MALLADHSQQVAVESSPSSPVLIFHCNHRRRGRGKVRRGNSLPTLNFSLSEIFFFSENLGLEISHFGEI